MPTTSVVVLCHRPADWLAASLGSIADQADEVILVDNGSPGGSAAATGRSAGAVVVEPGRNLGYAAGVNLGVSRASGELVALLNDDAVAGPGWLAAAASTLSDPQVAAVTPRIRYPGWWVELTFDDESWSAPGDPRVLGRQLASVTADGIEVLDALRGPGVHALEHSPGADPPRWRWTRPGEAVFVPVAGPGSVVGVGGEPLQGRPCRLLNKAGSWLQADGTLLDRGDGEPDDGRYRRPVSQFFASGTAVVFRAETWQRVGGLAEPFFAYYEDADWGWRARLAGLDLVYDPSVVVEHLQGATSGGSASPLVRRLAPGNHALCLARNAPVPAALSLIRRELRRRERDGARRSLLARLPWGVASRGRLARGWALSPQEVWDSWAGASLG